MGVALKSFYSNERTLQLKAAVKARIKGEVLGAVGYYSAAEKDKVYFFGKTRGGNWCHILLWKNKGNQDEVTVESKTFFGRIWKRTISFKVTTCGEILLLVYLGVLQRQSYW